MRWSPIFVIFLFSVVHGQTTPNLGLAKPAHGAPNWDVQLNGNFDILDNQAVSGSPTTGTQAVGNGTHFLSQPKPAFDVRDYGVIGNGVADDTIALQNAVNAACGTPFTGRGGKLIAPNGPSGG